MAQPILRNPQNKRKAIFKDLKSMPSVAYKGEAGQFTLASHNNIRIFLITNTQ